MKILPLYNPWILCNQDTLLLPLANSCWVWTGGQSGNLIYMFPINRTLKILARKYRSVLRKQFITSAVIPLFTLSSMMEHLNKAELNKDFQGHQWQYLTLMAKQYSGFSDFKYLCKAFIVLLWSYISNTEWQQLIQGTYSKMMTTAALTSTIYWLISPSLLPKTKPTSPDSSM